MKKSEQKIEWSELKDIWINSSQTRDIHFRMTELLSEVKNTTSHFEQDTIKRDLATLKNNWTELKGKVSQFERDSINKDLALIKRILKRFMSFFNKRCK